MFFEEMDLHAIDQRWANYGPRGHSVRPAGRSHVHTVDRHIWSLC